MNDLLIIDGVDLELLDQQRLALVRVVDAASVENRKATKEDILLVEGIQNMLDHWSDERVKPAAGPPTNRHRP